MVRVLFIVVFWSAFFLLRAFFRKYGLDIDHRLYNIIGSALFLSLVVIYWLFSAFLSAYFARAATEAPPPAHPAADDKLPTGIKDSGSDSEQVPANSKKSRVRVLRGNLDD